jgi:peptidoglycan/LPS O-acetylase OafA/YrhL
MDHDKKKYANLDIIRGLSALLVCVGHLRNVFFVDYSKLDHNPNLFEKIFYFITSLGHEAVLVFFLISGFLVGGSIIKNIHKFSFKIYLINRLTRLWVVLLPALFLTYIIDTQVLFENKDLFSGKYFDLINSGPKLNNYDLSVFTFLGNLFFLQTIFFNTYGTIDPIWSLANEFWYYVIFPLFLIMFGLIKSNIYKVITSSFIIILIFYFLPMHIIKYFLIWLLGVIIYFPIYKYKIKNFNLIIFLILLTVFGSILILSKFNFFDVFYNDLIVSVSGFFLIIYSFNFKININVNLKTKINFVFKHLSNFSYSLYIIHFPLCMVIFSKFLNFEKNLLNIQNFFYFLLFLFFILLCSFLFWFIFERNTKKINLLIKKKLI